MALNVGELFVKLFLEDQAFRDGIRKAAEECKNAEAQSKSLADHLAKMGNKLTLGVTAPMVGFGGAALNAAGDIEQSKIAFTTLLGSGQKAEGFMKNLQQFAAKTPFELPGLTDASRKLLAFGFDSKQILPTMTSIGNAISALGGGTEEINRVTMAIGQMKAKGKVSAEEMMQLAELGVPAWDMLAKKMGKSVDEVMAIAATPGGGIDAATGIDALMEGFDARFKGSMDKQSKTFLGQLSTLKDNARQGLADLGEAMMPMAKSALAILGPLTSILKVVGKLPVPIRVFILALGGLAAAAGPLLRIRALIMAVKEAQIAATVAANVAKLSFIKAWAAAAGPFLPIIAAIAAIAAGAYLVVRYWDPIKKFFSALWADVKAGIAVFFRWVVDMFQRYTLLGIVMKHWDGIVDFVKKLWDRVYDVTVGRLGRVINWIREKLAAVGNFFRDLYDKVVGHSYVPDLMDKIGHNFHQLDGRMVNPARQATRRVSQEFKELKSVPKAQNLVSLTMSYPDSVRRAYLAKRAAQRQAQTSAPAMSSGAAPAPSAGLTGTGVENNSQVVQLLTEQLMCLKQMVPQRVAS